ncbi:Golgi apparatus membrane protein TVP23-like protein [Plasmodium coatneyi]|uniref:Golgi apparatus membrane protein TVP23 homolog n=1 Tax=Plasmodium coatneyi TaxID=208452 RepID=A0A1B1E560_9APIC|nr:Golgi apparatus membrane protein TVP23-like protein [Plasmodium coatneyi]ANQ10162.1 Golgi apparatus membrane protein TVP23-like protein [Plasmodium coatneyi]
MDSYPFASGKNYSGSAQLPTVLGNPMSTNNSSSVNNKAPFDKNALTTYFDGVLNKSNHPYICFAHVFFKLLAVSLYFMGPSLFGSEESDEHDFIITFAVTLFLVSLDFYLVKNITGRLLVKMIWWIDANEDYSNKIIFKTSDESLLNATDKKVFWYALYVNFFIWLSQTLLMLLSFQLCWFLLCFLCLFLSFYNLCNFWKCSKEQHKVVGTFLSRINLNQFYKTAFSG